MGKIIPEEEFFNTRKYLYMDLNGDVLKEQCK